MSFVHVVTREIRSVCKSGQVEMWVENSVAPIPALVSVQVPILSVSVLYQYFVVVYITFGSRPQTIKLGKR